MPTLQIIDNTAAPARSAEQLYLAREAARAEAFRATFTPDVVAKFRTLCVEGGTLTKADARWIVATLHKGQCTEAPVLRAFGRTSSFFSVKYRQCGTLPDRVKYPVHRARYSEEFEQLIQTTLLGAHAAPAKPATKATKIAVSAKTRAALTCVLASPVLGTPIEFCISNPADADRVAAMLKALL